MDSEPTWKQLRLSLERPYKGDHGKFIPVVQDITPDGEHIYETKENPSARLGSNLRRIFLERGLDFFEKVTGDNFGSQDPRASAVIKTDEGEDDDEPKIMTYEDLRGMRDEIMGNLAVSLGEMTHAQQVLAALLANPSTNTESQTQSSSQSQSQSSSQAQAQLIAQPQSAFPRPNVNFSATQVTKPAPITSVQAFSAQLTIGGKDEALRHAAGLFKASAESMERTRLAGEKYWVDALKIRRNNWATGKGADKTSKDFLISFGLEESLVQFRRRAVGKLPSYSAASRDVIFPHRRKTRLRVSIVTQDQTGATHTTTNNIPFDSESLLDGALRSAQREIVEQEIFSVLVQEAGNLPTVSAKVSERFIVIDAAQGLELHIELVERSEMCDLIYHGFHLLLLRRHALLKEDRLGPSASAPPVPHNPASVQGEKNPRTKYPILQPIIDLLQYQTFLDRVRSEVMQVVYSLRAAGIPINLVMNIVGETGKELVKLLGSKTNLTVGGEIVLRIFDRHTIRFTFISPSTLVAHLSQSTLAVSSVPQLCQLLMDEVEQCLLNRIRDLGKSLSENVEGTWFIDLDHCVGRWEGCILNFRVTYGPSYAINCTAYFLGCPPGKQGQTHLYPPKDQMKPEFSKWVDNLVRNAVKQSGTGM
ncbi:Mediator of RNA polymerase II transcription subunit 17 [Leucoagaricus sp. SymC.cos]|nr:Mediator of RNA polymerase II transcription subunit 17 [Leucoagaricus sp. SymC.cos]